MAARPEDILGDYLDALLTADENTCAPPVSPANSPLHPLAKAALPSNIQKVPYSANLDLTGIAPALPVPADNQRAESLPVAPVTTLDEPARQQLQQLLNSAWQTNSVEVPAQVTQPFRVDPGPESIPTSVPVAEPINTPAQTPEITPALPAIGPLSTGKPAWAGKTFDSLIVEVAGLKLAIPLIVLGQIVRVTDGFAHLPGQGALFLGTLHTPRGTLRVINTALLIMPERYDAGFIEHVEFAVSIAQDLGAQNLPAAQSWQLALGVTKVAQPVNITSDDVVWRGERSKRPWLLGTVKTHMCALLDLSVIENIVAPLGN